MSQPEIELMKEREVFFDNLAGFDEGDLQAFLPPTVRKNPAAPPTLQKGSKGEAVRQLQNKLVLAGFQKGQGFQVKADGDFGKNTEAAVRAFQSKGGLAATGVADPATWSALDRAITAVAAGKPPEEAAKEAVAKSKKGAQVGQFIKEHGGTIAGAIGQLFGPKLQVPDATDYAPMEMPVEEEKQGWGAMQWGLLVGGLAIVGVGGFFAIRAVLRSKQEPKQEE
jgi:hypothetical protein